MERKKYLLVMAGGSGVRMGSGLPKQFMEIEGKAILRLTIEKFLRAVPDIKVVTVLPEAWHAYWKEYCYANNFICPQVIVKGGFTRFHSVLSGLAYIPDGASVAVQDGVRPLLSEPFIKRMFEAVEICGAAVPVIPVVDTLKVLEKSESGFLEKVEGKEADRSMLFGAQTPQVFYSEILKHSYEQPYLQTFTDDAAVVEAAGYKIIYPEGEKFNLKITTPDDLVIAKALSAR